MASPPTSTCWAAPWVKSSPTGLHNGPTRTAKRSRATCSEWSRSGAGADGQRLVQRHLGVVGPVGARHGEVGAEVAAAAFLALQGAGGNQRRRGGHIEERAGDTLRRGLEFGD